ncbi:MAG: formylglycine-generating enzyme family protein, partial [Nitrospinaceae bacterium]
MKRDIFFLAFYCLLAAGAAAADSLPAPAYPGMVLIPAGEFVLGFDANTPAPEFLSDRTTSSNAQPKQKINLEEFFIDRLEVTYGEFLRFKPQAEYAQGRLDQPIRGISWFEAEAYCFWVSKRLPTEMEWEKAARGADGRLFVWGNQFLRDKANFSKKVRKTGTTETDKSVFGVYDMTGN